MYIIKGSENLPLHNNYRSEEGGRRLVPGLGVWGTGTRRRQWRMKAGGASETERSACATIPFPGLKSPNVPNREAIKEKAVRERSDT